MKCGSPVEMQERELHSLAEVQGIRDIEDLNWILDRAVTLKAFLKSVDRVERIAMFVAEHSRTNVEALDYRALSELTGKPTLCTRPLSISICHRSILLAMRSIT
jgi:hypothetical protein